jgi:peptidoglycan/LPS O-acetylase OafA/YrhL
MKNQTRQVPLFGLDHLRAFAITIVFLYHYGGIFAHPQWINTIFDFGWTGVDLFFVLSGYLISSQLFSSIAHKNQVDFKTFFIKRFFRIIPPYLLVVAVYYFFPFTHERGDTAPAWKLLTFTQNLGLDLRTQGSFSHAWSLCIEEQFYLLLPLVLMALVYFKKVQKGWMILVFLFALGFFARYFIWQYILQFSEAPSFRILWMKWLYYPTYARLDGLLVGVSIAAIFRFKPTIKARLQPYGNGLLFVGIVLLTGCWFLTRDQASFSTSIFGFPLIAIAYGCFVSSAIVPTGFLYRFNSKITTMIASLSYAIYLTHKIVIHVTQEFLSGWQFQKDGNSVFLICVINSLLIAFALHQLVEKPFLLLRSYLLRTMQPAKINMVLVENKVQANKPVF